MRKRINTLDASRFMCGASAHFADVEDIPRITKEFKEQVIGKSDAFVFGFSHRNNTAEAIYTVASLAAKNKIYFNILYAYQFPPKGKRSHLNAELVEKIKRASGEYFLGEMFGETGTNVAAKDKGYYVEGSDLLALIIPPQNFKDMKEAKENYVSFIRGMVEYNKKLGIDKSSNVEPTALQKYNLEAGIGIACLEMMPAEAEPLVAFTRGASIGYKRNEWYGYIANEWYGGYYHEDPIKPKRLELAYKYQYMSGANMANLESGLTGMSSFGYKLSASSPECAEYRRVYKAFYNFAKKDKRPPCGPLAKIAFMHGNYDGFTGFLGGSSWCQFDREEWGKDSPERSWNILNDVYRGRDWHDFAVHSDENGYDLSCAPAYGVYDVIPAESPADVLKGYDLLIFAGWHTMTADIYENLKKYVSGGGRLLICASHLNVSPMRGGKPEFINGGKLSDFLGCDITGFSKINNGVKFRRNTLMKEVYYPAPKDGLCDANYPLGFGLWAEVALTSGRIVGVFSDTFDTPAEGGETRPCLVENAYGKGVVSFMPNVDYPGHPAVYKLYYTVVKELLTSSHRLCDLKVVANDKVRFSFFYNDKTGEEKLYLLNTDFNLPCAAIIRYKGSETRVSLKPLQLKPVDF